MSNRRKKPTPITLEIVLSGGIDESNKLGDTIVDIRITRDLTLRHVHESIFNLISGDEDEIEYLFDVKQPLPLDQVKTLAQLNINDGDRIIAQCKTRYKRSRKNEVDEVEDDEDTISLMVTTRIFQNEGHPMRKVKVVVKKHHSCLFLMNDVANLWNKTGLKFRYGRTVLIANKTFEELGIEEDGEVIVTGARS